MPQALFPRGARTGGQAFQGPDHRPPALATARRIGRPGGGSRGDNEAIDYLSGPDKPELPSRDLLEAHLVLPEGLYLPAKAGVLFLQPLDVLEEVGPLPAEAVDADEGSIAGEGNQEEPEDEPACQQEEPASPPSPIGTLPRVPLRDRRHHAPRPPAPFSAARPANRAASPNSSSIRRRRLYLATRSVRETDPV